MIYKLIKRIFDIFLGISLSVICMPIIVSISILIKTTSKGNILYWSKRIGKNSDFFYMPKFRTMRIDTPQLATHLLNDADKWLTPPGKFLRAHSLDEIPQLWSILKGDMSFVGPRPALYNQHDLIELRKEKKIDKVLPGLTGLAQINGRDELPVIKKVEFDEKYIINANFFFDLQIIFKTFKKVLIKEGIQH